MTFLQFSIFFFIIASLALTVSGRIVTPVKDTAEMSWMDTLLQKFLSSISSTSSEKAEKKVNNKAENDKDVNDKDALITVKFKNTVAVTTSDPNEPSTITSTPVTTITSTLAASTTAETPKKSLKLPSTSSHFSTIATRLKPFSNSPAGKTKKITIAPDNVQQKSYTGITLDTTSSYVDGHGEKLYVINQTVVNEVQQRCRHAILLDNYRPNRKIQKRVRHAKSMIQGFLGDFVFKLRHRNPRAGKKRHIGRKYIVMQAFNNFDHDGDGIITIKEMERYLEFLSIIKKRKRSREP